MILFDSRIIVEREYSIFRIDGDSKQLTQNKLLNNSIREFLLEYKLCSEENIDSDLLQKLSGIENKILDIEIFYDKWDIENTRYLIMVEYVFKKKALRKKIAKIIKRREAFVRLETMKSAVISRWDIFKRVRVGILGWVLRVTEGKIISRRLIRRWVPNFRLNKDKILKYTSLATQCFEARDYSGALSNYTMLLKYDKKNSEIFKNRGISKLHLKDYFGADNDLSMALNMGNNDIYIHYYRGKANEKTGNMEALRESYKKMIAYIKPFALSVEHVDIFLNNIKI